MARCCKELLESCKNLVSCKELLERMFYSDAPAAVVQFHSVGMKVEHHAIISESIANLLKDIGQYIDSFISPCI